MGRPGAEGPAAIHQALALRALLPATLGTSPSPRISRKVAAAYPRAVPRSFEQNADSFRSLSLSPPVVEAREKDDSWRTLGGELVQELRATVEKQQHRIEELEAGRGEMDRVVSRAEAPKRMPS